MSRHRSTHALSAVLLTSSMVACGSEAPSAEWGGEVVDSAGISLVQNPTEGIWTSTETWTFEETLRIGGLEGPAALQFGTVAGVAIDSRGQVYVLDQQAREVRVFDNSGEHVLTMGRPGSGPGELSQAAAGVFVGPGDTILVPDLLNSRVTRFTPGGEGVTGIPLQLTSGIPVRWELRGDGHLLAQLRGMPVPGMAALEGGDPVVAFDSDGSVVDTAFVLPQGQTLSATGGAPRIRLFEAEPVWDMEPGGDVTWAMNSEYRLHRQTPGDPVQLIATLPREARQVSETDRTVIRRAIRSLLEDQGIPPQAMDQVLQGIEFGDRYPVLANLLSGPWGTTLVQRPQTPEEMQALADAGVFDIQDLGSRIWDVFDTEGRFLGPVEFPGRFVPLQEYGDGFVGLDRDDMDVQSVVILRVTG